MTKNNADDIIKMIINKIRFGVIRGRKNMKRIALILLCILLASGFASCGTTTVSDGIQQETLVNAQDSEFSDISSVTGKTEQGKTLVLSNIYGQTKTTYVFSFADGKLTETKRYYQYTSTTLYERMLKFQFEGNENITATCDFIMKGDREKTVGLKEKEPAKGVGKATFDETKDYYTGGESGKIFTVVE